MNVRIFVESQFVEVWLHEGCAVWSPHIYVANNRTHGIDLLLDSTRHIVRELNST